ncbi:MarR family winged helix-turn-helix transcriptional regulator [Roseateles toxinivorans]|uniref:MarR family transcriptional regulator n=1 Tax=Roseateles toxinivorans TaxID=270368 RepID=A0A4V3CU21_9BURK|nr:MarR family transcriptional regulator [Roseateles toxinivorans]TDP75018.1 MarR family transcriptional regulator [Roseateles toxinivorans]
MAHIATPIKQAAPAADWQTLDVQLCFALYSSSLAMTKLYKPMLDPLGLTYPQYLVLMVLWQQDGLGVSALGERLHLDSGTLTPLIKRMEAAGWLTRQRAQDDERRVEVRLTPEGRQMKARAKNIPEQLACATACSLTELTDLTQRLSRLRDQLQKTQQAA